MALWLRDIALEWGESEALLPARISRLLGVPAQAIGQVRILRRAIDARRKPRLRRVYTVEFRVSGEAQLLQRHAENPHLQLAIPIETLPVRRLVSPCRVLVVGMGPAGLFAALRLAECGARVILIERGRPVAERVRDVERFWTDGQLDPESNVQFGEGGAGTFSDGKLSTRLNHPWLRQVLATLVAFGAPEEILVEARPHIGTDRLRLLLTRFRSGLQRLGVEIRYQARLTDLEADGARVTAGIVNDRERLPCDALVLAPGHSARDTYRMLAERGVKLEAKGFAVGVRCEHPRALIDRIQYGPRHPHNVPAADYTLRYNDPDSGRGVYSFCMCPGGEVINAASSAGEVVVNGMSRAARAADRSNSALVVTVQPGDWQEAGVLGGMVWQQELERRAFAVSGSYRAPAQNLLAFAGIGQGPCRCSCRPEVVEADLGALLPEPVAQGLRRALPHFDRQMRGFLTGEAVLVGVETRTSAPVRIVRDEQGVSVSHAGLYPAGEGAGYAGGIMSAALDGLRAAEQIVQQVNQGRTV